jgi:glycosyltransferase involved in cell wall biosynthesis
MIVGGAQEHVMLTSEMLRRQGWEVDILTGAQIGPEGSLIDEVKRRDLPMFIEPFLIREIHPLKDVIAFFRIVRVIRKRRYDIVHTNSSKAGILGRWAARAAGVPVIVHTVHGWGFHDRQNALERNLYIRMERFTRRFTHAYVAVTVRDIDKGVKNGIGHPADYVVIRSGIELSRFRNPVVPRDIVRRRLGIPESAKVVGTVTRLSPQKAPLVFARAILMAAGRMPDAYFVIVGDGPLRPKVEAFFASTDVAHRVILTGIRDDVPDLMAAFDVFVLSSLWEGLPRVIPQAMINGLPVIVSAIDGNVEIIRDFTNGRLVPPGDAPALAEAMVHTMKNPDIARALGDAGRREAARFDASTMGNQTAHLYRRLLVERRAESRFFPRFSPVTLDN